MIRLIVRDHRPGHSRDGSHWHGRHHGLMRTAPASPRLDSSIRRAYDQPVVLADTGW